jgi:hypothetical protein
MQREKLAGLGTMAAGLAHELNNPASAIARGAPSSATPSRRSRRRRWHGEGSVRGTPRWPRFATSPPERPWHPRRIPSPSPTWRRTSRVGCGRGGSATPPNVPGRWPPTAGRPPTSSAGHDRWPADRAGRGGVAGGRSRLQDAAARDPCRGPGDLGGRERGPELRLPRPDAGAAGRRPPGDRGQPRHAAAQAAGRHPRRAGVRARPPADRGPRQRTEPGVDEPDRQRDRRDGRSRRPDHPHARQRRGGDGRDPRRRTRDPRRRPAPRLRPLLHHQAGRFRDGAGAAHRAHDRRGPPPRTDPGAVAAGRDLLQRHAALGRDDAREVRA